MERLLSFAAKLERISSAIGRLAAWAIIALVLVIMTDVILRRWFVIGSTKLQELEWHLHGFLFLLCLGWAYTKNAHVRIELVSERLSARTRAWIELVGCILFLLPYVSAVLWFGYDYVSYSWAYNEASASPTGLPDRWIIKSAIVIGFAVLGIAAISRLLQAVVFLFGRPEQAERTPFSQTEPQTGES
ncbi:TRAP transporter small permease subunit [Kordiimonas lacus]|uniref:TRAP transporter small permease protein n=1 Tax=Kordiimonas lacus TaxID=637679 RepID=A0A1G6VY31_9PROT|nr:TRAP transporter small permease subunit [Kordiimonas lacus]SDD57705.1 TRAP-type mannitol/chloroaromatic compound transport system, small permease component [Kordiimonas lacus]